MPTRTDRDRAFIDRVGAFEFKRLVDDAFLEH